MKDNIQACLNCQATDCDPFQCPLRGYVPIPERVVDARSWRRYAVIPPITANGETHTLSEWAELTGVSYNAIYMRIRRGMAAEQAVLLPNQPKGHKRKKRGNCNEHPEQHRPADP